MKKQNVIAIASLWILLTACAWFAPDKEFSFSERRPLEQLPTLRWETLLSGKYMDDFEDYALDQFPLRDSFRTVKSLFHTRVLGQRDNNGIYFANGYAVKQEYPLDQDSLDHAVDRFTALRDTWFPDNRIFLAVVPDKGCYLAKGSGHLTLDYGEMTRLLQEKMPWATPIDLWDSLDAGDYYRTDTHWRQEQLLPAAAAICEALGVTPPKAADYTLTALERPFYGVYYGQAALPMAPDTLYLMESDLLKDCSVYDYETGTTGAVYDLSKLESKDLYDIYLSGAKSLLTIENPHAETDRELIVFRDSFGSAMVPLLVQDYGKVTLVDIRYIQMEILDRFLTVEDQDVLLLYSTLVLNNSETIK